MVDHASEHRSSGVSLIGTVLVLVILGVMAAIAAKTLSGDPGLTSPLTTLPVPAASAGGGRAGSAGSAGSGSAGRTSQTTRAVSLVGEAAIRACEADVASIQTALQVAEAAGGPAPTDLNQLVQGGWLQQVPALSGYRYSLASGQVLVNGQPSAQGCQAPTSP